MAEEKELYYSPSIMVSKEDDKLRLVSFPPIDNIDMTTVDRIIYAVFRSTHHSSKKCNYCELDGNYYSENDNNLTMKYLDGAQQISKHHCYGCIQYHKSNEKLFDQANMYFETDKNIINKQSFAGKPIKIQRSSGEIVEGHITKDSCLRIIDDNLMMYVEFIVDNEIYYKYVSLFDYTIRQLKNEMKGILTLNPELKDEELILTIKNNPEWLNKYREPWKALFTTKLDEFGIKYKFIYEE